MTAPSLPWPDIVGAAAVPILMLDAEGRVVGANRAFLELLGYERAQIETLDIARLVPAEDAVWLATAVLRLSGGELDRFDADLSLVCGDGTEMPVRLALRPVPDPRPDGWYIVASATPDLESPTIVDRSVADRLLTFAGESVALVDMSGRIIVSWGSPVGGERLAPSPFQDQYIWDLFSADEWDRFTDQLATLRSTPGSTIERDVEVLAPDGSRLMLSTRTINCLEDPVLNGFVVVARDVTAERAHLSELSRRHQMAEAVVDARNRLLATVSHELRNPLHVVRGLAELLLDEELGPRAGELAATLLRQVSSLTHVTQDLLDAARFDAGRVVIKPVPTDVQLLIDDVVGMGRMACDNDGAVVIVGSIEPDVPAWLLADADRVRQVLSNLVGNAIKFTPTGTIDVGVRLGDHGGVIFSVADTGVGIPADEQSAILEPFIVASTAGDSQGAGLGLSVVQRLVTAMSGHVYLASTVGVGTRIEVSLPLPACDRPTDVDPGELPAGLRILVVEDNPVNQQLARSQLDRLGLVPVIVGTGEEGLAALLDGSKQFDVVLMDQQLPGWSGTETTRRIRELDGALGAVPIIGLSASASRADYDAFMTAGMDDFVPKPASLDDLSGAIGAAVRRGRSDGSERGAADLLLGAGSTEDAVPTHPADADFERLLDVGVLAALSDELGGAGIVTELVDVFLRELDGRIGVLVAGASEEARRTAHTLKSSARLLGAGALAAACAEIEHGATAPDDLTDLADRSRRALGTWLDARGR